MISANKAERFVASELAGVKIKSSIGGKPHGGGGGGGPPDDFNPVLAQTSPVVWCCLTYAWRSVKSWTQVLAHSTWVLFLYY